MAMAASVGFISAGSGVSAAKTGCGSNDFVESIDYTPVGGGDFRIKVSPADPAWHAVGVREVTVVMWHSIQSCVPGLYGAVADSVWQQLECHQTFPIEKASGPTWDLESWRPALVNPTTAAYIDTHCLNVQSLFSETENGEPGYGINQPGLSGAEF